MIKERGRACFSWEAVRRLKSFDWRSPLKTPNSLLCWKFQFGLPPATIWARETRLFEWQERVICTSQPPHACCTQAARQKEPVVSEFHLCVRRRSNERQLRLRREISLTLTSIHMSCMLQTDFTGQLKRTTRRNHHFSLVLKIIDGDLAPSCGRKLCASGSLVGLWSLELSTATE